MSFMKVLLQTAEMIAPLSTLTYASSRLTDADLGKFTRFLIRQFIRTFKINLEECADPNPEHYSSFNAFFTRALKPGARPIAENCLAVCPCDGTVSQADDIIAGRLIQAKGIDYSLRALLGGMHNESAPFEDGQFITVYLSPADYHRVHMPLNGTLRKTIHIPGKHFPVGKLNMSMMPDLYTKNERLVCIFDTEHGPFAMILVGAALVGSISTVWDGTLVRRRGINTKYFEPDKYVFKRGDEIGAFKYGSTVICLWSQERGDIDNDFEIGEKVKMGQPMII